MNPAVIVTKSYYSSIREAEDLGYLPTVKLLETTGITVRRLNYWEARGLFGRPVPCGTGFRRMWNPELIPVLRILGDLTGEFGQSAHLPLRIVKSIIDDFHMGQFVITPRVAIVWETS